MNLSRSADGVNSVGIFVGLEPKTPNIASGNTFAITSGKPDAGRSASSTQRFEVAETYKAIKERAQNNFPI